MDGPQVLEVILLGQDEDHGVVAVAAAGVHLAMQRLVTWQNYTGGSMMLQQGVSSVSESPRSVIIRLCVNNKWLREQRSVSLVSVLVLVAPCGQDLKLLPESLPAN